MSSKRDRRHIIEPLVCGNETTLDELLKLLQMRDRWPASSDWKEADRKETRPTVSPKISSDEIKYSASHELSSWSSTELSWIGM